MKPFLTFLIGVIFTTQICFSQEFLFTKRSRNEVREGPGNYYDLLRVLPAGVKIVIQKKEGSWLNIKTPDYTKGWISKNCLSDKLPERENQKDVETEWTSPKASKAGIAAAIRGFAERFGKANKSNLDLLESFEKTPFPTDEFISFTQKTLRQTQEVPYSQLGNNAEVMVGEYHFDNSEEGIGTGIASRVATRGLVNDKLLIKYVNFVGTYLLEMSPVFDSRFRFLILDESRPAAFAIPGGYIFITKGLLELCDNEAELAGALAHELIHVFKQHGRKEMNERKYEQRQDDVFGELEQETSVEQDTSEEALNEFALEAWETVNKPRTLLMEEEADRGGAILMAHSGYDPKSLVALIKKIETVASISVSTNLEDENPFAYLDFKQRKEHLQNFLNENLSKVSGNIFEDRFTQNAKK